MPAMNRVPNEQALSTILVGTQVFRDTPVVPTYKWYGTLQMTENRPITESDEYAGTFFADYEPTYGPMEISGTYGEDLTFQDFAIKPRYLIKGGVTGVSDGNTIPGYAYTYAPSPSRDDIDVATMQNGYPGAPKQGEMVLFDQATISADADNSKAVWQLSGNLWARKNDLITTTSGAATGGSTTTLVKTGAGWTVNQFQGAYVFIRTGAAAGNAIEVQSNTIDTLTFVGALPAAVANTDQFEISGRFTPGISDRTRDKIAAPGTVVTIDDYPGGTIGTTSVPRWISWSVTYQNNLSAKRFGPDVDMYSAKLGRGKIKITGQIRLEFDDPIEFEKYRAKTMRRMRIKQTGPQINASPVTNMYAQIDLPKVAWSQVTQDVRGTNITATYAFVGYVDTVAGYPMQTKAFVPMAALP